MPLKTLNNTNMENVSNTLYMLDIEINFKSMNLSCKNCLTHKKKLQKLYPSE